jgi:hypothetical protein
VVAPDLDLLRKVVDEMCDYPIFIVSPITRYIRGPCCNAEDHVTNFNDPDFLGSILSGLTKLRFLLRKKNWLLQWWWMGSNSSADQAAVRSGPNKSSEQAGWIRFIQTNTAIRRWR